MAVGLRKRAAVTINRGSGDRSLASLSADTARVTASRPFSPVVHVTVHGARTVIATNNFGRRSTFTAAVLRLSKGTSLGVGTGTTADAACGSGVVMRPFTFDTVDGACVSIALADVRRIRASDATEGRLGGGASTSLRSTIT